MKPKLIGCCTKCDEEVFEIVRRDPETRVPVQIGAPLETAMRANFVMADGSRMDLTFCRKCSDGLTPEDLPHIWNRVVSAWEHQSPGHAWTKTQRDNGLLMLLNVKPWKEVR